MRKLKTINSNSHKALLLLLVAICTQLVVKYIFLTPIQSKKIDTKKNYILSTINKNAINEIHIKSSNLSLSLLKLNSGWSLIAPRKFPANTIFLNHFIDQLLSIKIQDVLTNDLINKSNYSLDNPLYTITLKGAGIKHTFKFGLINTILKSTYLKLSNQNVIYKTSTPQILNSNMRLSNFINTHVLKYHPNQIKKLTLYYGSQSNNKIALLLQLKDQTWVGKKNRILDKSNTLKRVREYLSIKSQIIFDSLNEQQQQVIDRKLKYPKYTLVINTGKLNHTFSISYLLPQLKKLKINANEYFIISSKESIPYLVKKEYLNIFNLRESKLRKTGIKKLFY